MARAVGRIGLLARVADYRGRPVTPVARMIHTIILVFVSAILAVAQQRGPGKSGDDQTPVDPTQYVGTETCKGCHEETGTSFAKNPHARTQAKHQGPQWQCCEAGHGPGKGHAPPVD